MNASRILRRLEKLEAAAGWRDQWAEWDAALRRAIDSCPEAKALEAELLSACDQHEVDFLGLFEHPDRAIAERASELSGRMMELLSLHQQREGA